VREAGIGDRDLVIDIDIGAGRGALTTALRRVGAQVVALELDPRLARSLRERFIADDRVGIFAADARHWTWPDQPFAVVSSLPFAAAASILRAIAQLGERLVRNQEVAALIRELPPKTSEWS